jgi:predicted ArsR family transcriptional regulator
MKQTIDLCDFERAFHNLRPDNFTNNGLAVLFEYLEELEQDTGEEYELDIIALCCDFSEDSWESIADSYSIDLDDCEDDDEKEETVKEYLIDEGVFVGEVSGGFVYRQH